MNSPVQTPVKGQKMRASWGAAVSAGINALQPMGAEGLLARQGVAGTGFAPLPANLRDRKVAAALHPWKVLAFAKSEERDSCFEIYVPETALHVGEDLLEVEDITPVDGQADRYTLDCESEISESAVIYLAVVKNEPEEGEEAQWEAHVISTLESIEDASEVLVILPIAKLSIDSSGEYEVGKVDVQYAHSSVAFGNPEDEENPKTPSPFDYVVTEQEDQESGEPVKTGTVTNNVFYWDGVLQELDDFETSATCTVYLTCTQEAPSSSNPDPDWEFELAESVAASPTGGKAINFKLYDIEDHKVTMDYRTTFLDLSSPHRVAWFTVMKPTGRSSVVIDATDDDNAAVSVVGNGKSILLDTRDLTSGKQVRVRTLTVEHSDGTKTEYKVLADQNVTVKEGGGDLPDVDLLKDIELKYDTSTHYFTAKKTTYNPKTGQTTVGNEETIFTAVPHSTNASAS